MKQFVPFKASFSFHKITPQTLKWLPYILICHCTSLSPWFIILDKKHFVKVSHHYWIPVWAPMYSIMEWQSGANFFSRKYSRWVYKDPQKFILFVGEMVFMNNLEWPKLSYYVIYYEKFRKAMHWTEKEALTWLPSN